MNILLIAGGWSSEREVSLSGAEIIEEHLLGLGHQVARFDPLISFSGVMSAARENDFAFINMHGSPGEDGLLQAMLEKAGCPYQGSGPAASMLALDKAASKTLFTEAGLNNAPWTLLHEPPSQDWRPEFPFPLFIKANTGGSSLHMEKVETPEDLQPALQRLFAHGSCYMVESAVTGVEVTCAVLDTPSDADGLTALPPVLIRPAKGTVFDYHSKYVAGAAEELCPAPIPASSLEEIQHMALQAHRILGLSGYSRSDFILPEEGPPFLLETNTLPGMTANSLLPKAAAAAGISYGDLLIRLIDLGLAKRR